jgi:hypothetical protein
VCSSDLAELERGDDLVQVVHDLRLLLADREDRLTRAMNLATLATVTDGKTVQTHWDGCARHHIRCFAARIAQACDTTTPLGPVT